MAIPFGTFGPSALLLGVGQGSLWALAGIAVVVESVVAAVTAAAVVIVLAESTGSAIGQGAIGILASLKGQGAASSESCRGPPPPLWRCSCCRRAQVRVGLRRHECRYS